MATSPVNNTRSCTTSSPMKPRCDKSDEAARDPLPVLVSVRSEAVDFR